MSAPETGPIGGGLVYDPSWGAPIAVEFGAVDADGTAWILNDVQDDAPTVGEVVQQSGDPGGWPGPQYLGPRPLTVVVTAIATTQALRDKAYEALCYAAPVNDLAVLRLDEATPKQLMVRRSGPPGKKYPNLTAVEVTLGLIAPDPRRYGTVLNTLTAGQGAGPAGLAPPWTPPITLPAGALPMSVSAVNNGNFETRPQVRIDGPITGPAVVNQNTGQTVAYSGLTLAAGDQLLVDFSIKQAFLNGVFRPADLGAAWWVMQPGPTGIQVTGTANTGAAMTVTWRDAWS